MDLLPGHSNLVEKYWQEFLSGSSPTTPCLAIFETNIWVEFNFDDMVQYSRTNGITRELRRVVVTAW